MNILDFIGSVVTSAVVTGFLSAFLIWLSKSWLSERLKNAIKNEYDEKLETHKSILIAENGRNLEKLKSELQLAAITHQVQYSKLHEERASVIKELYKKLDKLASDAHSLLNPTQWPEENSTLVKEQIAFDAGEDFKQYYLNNKIFFSKSLCAMIDEVHLQILSCNHWFMSGYAYSLNSVSSEAHQDHLNMMSTAYKKLEEKVIPLKENIEDQFRELLGVEGD